MEAETELPAQPELAAAEAAPAAGKCVLIVDDLADERSIQRAMLEHRGYRVVEAADGEEALVRTREHRPNLVLLDIAMPKMDGIEVCRTLRENPETAAIAVLFYTASPEQEWKQRVAEVRASGVLGKPLDPHAVADEVERLIGPPTA